MLKKIFKLSLFSLIFIPFIVSANTKSNSIYIKEGETVMGNLITSSQNIVINGTVGGDVIVFTNSLIINGRVDGDVIAVAQNAYINGEIGGNLRILASYLNINASIARNVNVFSLDLLLDEKTNIAWDLNAKVKSAKINGVIGGSIDIRGKDISILGKIKKNVIIYLNNEKKGNLVIDNKAIINGDLNYYFNKELDINTKPIAGIINFNKKGSDNYQQLISPAWRFAFSFFSTVIIGLLLILVFPRQINQLFSLFKEKYLKLLLVGILSIIISPIIILLLAVSVIGLPLALLILCLYLALFFLAKTVIAIILGKISLNLILKNRNFHWLWPLLFGSLLISILFFIPYLNYLIQILSFSLGLGLILSYAYYQSKNI